MGSEEQQSSLSFHIKKKKQSGGGGGGEGMEGNGLVCGSVTEADRFKKCFFVVLFFLFAHSTESESCFSGFNQAVMDQQLAEQQEIESCSRSLWVHFARNMYSPLLDDAKENFECERWPVFGVNGRRCGGGLLRCS